MEGTGSSATPLHSSGPGIAADCPAKQQRTPQGKQAQEARQKRNMLTTRD
jgi:hypothetical protein